MDLSNHLLYIDITNSCNLNCKFCMYREERMKNLLNLKLNPKSKKKISDILNYDKTERLIISGEGEPFNNIDTIFDILNLSKGKRKIQIISNGVWLLSKKADEILEKLNQISRNKKDEYQMRISCDSFHIEMMGIKNYKKIIDKIINYIEKGTNIQMCFRGLLEEKRKLLELFSKKLLNKKYFPSFKKITELETEIIINDIRLNFIFKNIVNLNNLKENFTLNHYISSLEKIYKKPFTFGHLKKGKNGMDITIKSNGDLFFYGVEIYSFFNINTDNVTIKLLNKTIEKNKILKILYTKPFKEIISDLSKYPQFKKIIHSINNPYWIIKNVYKYDEDKFREILKC